MCADAYHRGKAFSAAADNFKRPLFLLAHHDDEIGAAGLLQRLGSRAHVVWTTNSDGRYFDSDMDPPAYGEFRKREGLRSLAVVGLPEDRGICLDFSEVEIYRHMAGLHSGQMSWEQARLFFEGMRDKVREIVFELRPDAVVTMAWQGGQPEHDLTHFFTHLALRELAAEAGERPAFFHFPAYEYTYALAMRFHPLYKGTRIRLRLTGEEMARKKAMIEAYPSQVSLFRYFRWAFTFVGWPLAVLTGGPRTLEDFLAIEEFGPVPEDLDYTADPHRYDFLTYMFDEYEGTRVTFRGSIRPVVQAFL